MSNLSMVMSFKCSNCCKVVLINNASNVVLMCKIGEKYQYTIRAECADAHAFWKPSGCVLIEACALIKTNTVGKKNWFSHDAAQLNSSL